MQKIIDTINEAIKLGKDAARLNSELNTIVSRGDCIDAINEVEYHTQAEGCGLEDHGITNRYDAMAYGWEQAMKRAIEAIENC